MVLVEWAIANRVGNGPSSLANGTFVVVQNRTCHVAVVVFQSVTQIVILVLAVVFAKHAKIVFDLKLNKTTLKSLK